MILRQVPSEVRSGYRYPDDCAYPELGYAPGTRERVARALRWGWWELLSWVSDVIHPDGARG